MSELIVMILGGVMTLILPFWTPYTMLVTVITSGTYTYTGALKRHLLLNHRPPIPSLPTSSPPSIPPPPRPSSLLSPLALFILLIHIRRKRRKRGRKTKREKCDGAETKREKEEEDITSFLYFCTVPAN